MLLMEEIGLLDLLHVKVYLFLSIFKLKVSQKDLIFIHSVIRKQNNVWQKLKMS